MLARIKLGKYQYVSPISGKGYALIAMSLASVLSTNCPSIHLKDYHTRGGLI